MPIKDPRPDEALYYSAPVFPAWQKCPICFGKGIVPHGFYDSPMTTTPATSTKPEKCRSCNGRGIVR